MSVARVGFPLPGLSPEQVRRARGLGAVGDIPVTANCAPWSVVPTAGGTDPVSAYDRHAVMPLHGDLEFRIGGQTTLLASAIAQVICSFQVPPAYQGTVRLIGNGVGNISDLPNVTWSLRVNGDEVPGYGHFVGYVAVGSLGVWNMRRDLMPSDQVDIIATNATAVAIPLVTALFYGWAWVLNA